MHRCVAFYLTFGDVMSTDDADRLPRGKCPQESDGGGVRCSCLLAFVSVAFASVGVLVALPRACAAAQGTGDLPVEIVPPAQHTQGINSSAFSRDNDDRFVATSGYDAVIKLWDVRTGRLYPATSSGSIRITNTGA